MIGYRVVTAGREADAFSGTGSFLYGGRWSSPGTRMVYASTHLSLAALEVLVHAKKRSFIASRMAIRFEIDDASLMRLDETALPLDWSAFPAPVSAQRAGDEWVRSLASLGLLVPTAALPHGEALEERNILLNPGAPDFVSRIIRIESFLFRFDSRIADVVS